VLVLVALARALSRSAAVEVPPRGERADGE